MLVLPNIVSKLAALFIPLIVPPCHIAILYYLYNHRKPRIDTVNCDCLCWDTIFKGPYEYGPAGFKHFYFNTTETTLKIWTIVVLGIVFLYESVHSLIQLLLKRKLRYSMLLLFISSIFPHYYAWWTCINYYNDVYFVQWNHQLFFTITELISTLTVLFLANVKKRLTYRKLLLIIVISQTHIIVSGADQFVINIWAGKGKKHQVIRDLGLMIPDLLHTFIPAYHIDRQLVESNLKIGKIDVVFAVVLVILLSQYAINL